MIDTYLDTAITAVRKSGGILTEYFQRLHDCRNKNVNIRDLVTEVDILSERSIKKIIRDAFPEHSIIAEESDTERKDPERVWHVDPLDGTVNYSQGIPLCAVSVALEERGVLAAGAIYNPFAEELYFAARGKGAFCNGEAIRVSDKNRFQDGLYVAAFSSAAGPDKIKEYLAFGAVNDASRGALRIGSAAVALCYLARGRIDGFWSKDLNSWDLAAGILLVREAAGRATGTLGRDYDFSQSLLIASNGSTHEALAGVLSAQGVD
jgi:myo-inositol-1(or 4)-monophosphatase